MSTQRLTSLTIQNLRGSTETFTLNFHKNKPLTVIYGENGTGKSTICDAFEFLGHGKVGSIEGRGLGKGLPNYWASLGKKSEDISVGLETASGICQAQVNKSIVVIDRPELKPKIEILRRSQILGLIDASPSERYKAIARFIDVSGVEDSEKNLVRLIKDLKKSSETAIAITQESIEAIKSFHPASDLANEDLLAWAKTEADRDFSLIDPETRALEKLKASYSILGQQVNRLKRAFAEVKVAEVSLGQAQEKFNAITTNAPQETSELLDLWTTAQRYFHNHDTVETCPLCDSAENTDELAANISQRLERLSDFSRVTECKRLAIGTLDRAKQKLQLTKEEIRAAIQTFQQSATSKALPENTPLPETELPRKANQLLEWLAATQAFPEQWNELNAQRQDKKKFLAALKKSLKNYQENFEAQETLEALIPKLERALEICEQERKQFTDELLSKIADEVGRLYEKIHPGEGKEKISLELNPNRRASLDINTEFCGETNVMPQAYFSESHLDTLGLCVFLALAGLDVPDQTILVLDDVLASVDEPHVERLINLLHEEAQRFRHCVMTTHYRPWREKFRWGWVEKGQCHFVELRQWSIARGLGQVQDVPEVQRLKDLLSADCPDPQLVCAKAGFILEAVLDFLTHRYGCRLPRCYNNRYTIGALLDAINGKLMLALRVEVLSVADDGSAVYTTRELAPMLTELKRVAQARNEFGAHFNMSAFEHPEQDALVFGKAVLEIAETLIDPENGWPKHNKSGSYWSTGGETRRMHPLLKPD